MSRSAEIIALLRALGERMDRLERMAETSVPLAGDEPDVVLILTALKTLSDKVDRLDAGLREAEIRTSIYRCDFPDAPAQRAHVYVDPEDMSEMLDDVVIMTAVADPRRLCQHQGCDHPAHFYNMRSARMFCSEHVRAPVQASAYIDPITATVAD